MRQAAHPGQPVHDAGLLVAVDGAELEEPQRKFAIGPAARPEDQAVHRAVHRLEVVVLARACARVPSSLYSASRCIGGNMPSAYQSRWPEILNSCALVMCGLLTNS